MNFLCLALTNVCLLLSYQKMLNRDLLASYDCTWSHGQESLNNGNSGSHKSRHLGIRSCMGKRHKTCIRSCMDKRCSTCHSKQPLAQHQLHACAACIRSFHSHSHRRLGHSKSCSKQPLAQPQLHACAACIRSFHSHRLERHIHKSMEHSCIHKTSGHKSHSHRCLGHNNGCSKQPLAQHQHQHQPHACAACIHSC